MIRNRSIVRGVRATTLVAVAVSAVVVGCATFMGSPGVPVVELDVDTSGCDAPHLEWKSARKTNYTSYPEPGSEECIVYSGCKYEGLFYACESKKSEAWVKTHNIAAFFPNVDDYKLHDLCIRSGEKTMVVTVYDTCGDQDCDGCCTKNKGAADALIDLESYTNARFGVADGPIQWADLGPTKSEGCSGGGRSQGEVGPRRHAHPPAAGHPGQYHRRRPATSDSSLAGSPAARARRAAPPNRCSQEIPT